jgi:hypothetical protein
VVNEERRQLSRRKFYSSDEIKAVLRKGSVALEGFVTDLSPAGASVAIPALGRKAAIEVGAHAELVLRMGSLSPSVVLRAVVVSVSSGRASGKPVLRLGLSFVALQDGGLGTSERRQGLRFPCSDFLVPSGWCEHPWIYQEKILFRILEFGNGSLTLEVSARNQVLLKGLEVDAWLSFPGQMPLACKLQFLRVQATKGARHRVRVVARFVSLSAEVGQAVATYCMMVNPAVSLADLRRAGYFAGSLGSVVVCDYANTEDDMKQISSLRGELDAFDKFSRQIVCKVGGKVVACARLVFNGGKRERSAFSASAILPSALWKAGFLEVSRWVVQSDFENTDVPLELLRFVVRVGFHSHERYLLMECDDRFLPDFLGMGAQKLNLRVSKEQAKSGATNIVRWDCHALKAGWGGDTSQWAQAFGPVLRTLSKRGSLSVSSRARVRMALERYAKTDSGKKALSHRKER